MHANESTYALIIRSEEKNRGILEVVLYAFFILSAIISIGQFALQPVSVPAAGLLPGANLANATDVREPARG